ncbi:hypothetical protein [Phenylobacterium sp.]|uniref:hypothetical protein n=1 Tax=Phenylobacterium sp. TaxID=1871053 RepID=UPI00272F51E9|nr:hypothetical protein [Phenylobacterium sp.]MDP1873601.1 hypothetical protein [Phenylobacterium sp.]
MSGRVIISGAAKWPVAAVARLLGRPVPGRDSPMGFDDVVFELVDDELTALGVRRGFTTPATAGFDEFAVLVEMDIWARARPWASPSPCMVLSVAENVRAWTSCDVDKLAECGLRAFIAIPVHRVADRLISLVRDPDEARP